MAKFEVGVHAVVFDKENRILLVHRRDMDLWDLPGGGLDPGEIPTEAAVRETKEETGLDVEVERLFIVAVAPENLLGFTFYCRVVGGEATPTDESDDVRYFSLDGLPENISPRNREMIKFSAERHPGITYLHVNLPSVRQWLAELEKQKTQAKEHS
jgi:ADP-ribose pyrophosphatase YjhB (NUDIX family)